ncbi:zinc ribbon-containing protein [Trinickia sp. LjRoot230]|uniref:zinc ribbon-containing protein n=1 Tax=Trinickia sp. LjRoot230 TaxID=3342288 RepID=UPI003ECD13A0
MSVKAGEKAQKSGDLHCEKCHHEVHVTVGRKIPRCPHCGNESYSSRTHETGNKSS